jgi:hypothetical protein
LFSESYITILCMHTYEEYRQILELWEQGFKKKRIAIMTGINRATVRECIVRYENVEGLEKCVWLIKHREGPQELRVLKAGMWNELSPLFEAYAYLLGLYLGDGCLAKDPRTYRLRIALDLGYPDIILRCMDAIRVVVPHNTVNTMKKHGNCVEVYSFNSYWPNFFPQHGSGPKHERPIILESWQQQIVETFPLDFFRGLYHSDGSRPHNVVNGKDYPRYEFNNKSGDILNLFSRTCDVLGLHWRTASGGLCVQIARRPDVAFLDAHIGPKS